MVTAAEPETLPPTPRKPVKDTYHGVEVGEDYRWLEEGEDPSVRKWSEQQNAYTRTVLDKLPARPALIERLKGLHAATSPDHFGLRYRGGVLFAMKLQPPKNQPFLVTLASADKPETARAIFDPNEADEKGGISIDFYVPSQDGKLVAICLSRGGSEDGNVSVYDVATGEPLPDEVPRVNYPTGGGSLAWNADSTGFFYTRFPQGDERPEADRNFYQQVYFHKLGTQASEDRYEIGRDFPRIAETQLYPSTDGKRLVAAVANGDGGEFAHYLRDAEGKWSQLTRFADLVTEVRCGPEDTLYFLSNQDSPRGRILRARGDAPKLAAAETVIPESDVVIKHFVVAESRLYVTDLAGGPSQIRSFDLDGKPRETLPAPPISSTVQVVPLEGDEVLFRVQSYVTPPAWYRFDPATGKTAATKLVRTSPADFSQIEVTREFARSEDGTRVPINILKRKGTKLDKNNPTLLYGYGGYGISMSPSFQMSRIVWLEQGGVLAIANLRGGGEFGEEWHKAGNLTKKQNVFDDFAACAQHLIEAGYTKPERLAVEGGSNGGLLIGAAITQHPELFRAAIAHVGIFDMVRVELHPNGAFNVTEFGTVKESDQFQALHAYSPYHHVKDGGTYPAILFLTGHNDGRVDPYHSRKMTARLQAATAEAKTKRPVLLRYSFDSGHGMGTALSERIEQEADVYAFLMEQLGMK